MIGRVALAIVAVAIGVAVATFVPGLSESLRNAVGLASGRGATQLQETAANAPEPRMPCKEPDEDKPALVRLTQDQITAARIDLTTVRGGMLARCITVPGTVVPHADRIARVSVRLSAIVAELRKKIGDPVAKDEILAILESREVADAKSEYLAARLTDELQQDLFQRDKMLWDKRVSNEQQFLRSRNAAAQTRMRLDIARQKLLALGLAQKEIAVLPEEPEGSLRRQAIRSPIAGRVVERKVDLGTAVGRDNLETELFVIADLDRVWVELAISPADLPAIKEGQPVSISARRLMRRKNQQVTAEYDTCGEFGTVFNLSDSSVRRLIRGGIVDAIRINGAIRIPKTERERLRRANKVQAAVDRMEGGETGSQDQTPEYAGRRFTGESDLSGHERGLTSADPARTQSLETPAFPRREGPMNTLVIARQSPDDPQVSPIEALEDSFCVDQNPGQESINRPHAAQPGQKPRRERL